MGAVKRIVCWFVGHRIVRRTHETKPVAFELCTRCHALWSVAAATPKGGA